MNSKMAVGGDLLLSIVQAYMLAAHQQGLSAEEARARFEANYAAFMDETAAPVEKVKE